MHNFAKAYPSKVPGAIRNYLPLLAIFFAALLSGGLAFGVTLNGHFLGDDFGYIARFSRLPFSDWPRLFVHEWSDGMWGLQLRELRPFTALSLMIDARFWGGNASGYRVTNLLIHAICATLVGLIAWRSTGRSLMVGLAGAVLFAWHPAHAEPVLWITGRVDVLATLFYLAGFYAFLRYRETLSGLSLVLFTSAYAAAAFSKEFGLTLPAMLVAADLLWCLSATKNSTARKTWNLVAPYIGAASVLLVYYFCRRAAFGPGGTGTSLPDWTSSAFHEQFAQRQLTYLGHLLPPLGLWFVEGAPLLVHHAVRTLALVAVGVAIALAAHFWLFRRRRATSPAVISSSGGLFFGLGWYLVATLPLVITYVSARHLYLASAGVCIALAVALHAVLRARVAFAVGALALAALFAHRLTLTTAPWSEAGRRSHEVAQQLAWVAAHAKPGAVVLIDLPPSIHGAFFWAWATPFALRPPFTPEPLDDRLIILEDMATYYDWERWHQRPVLGKLATVTEESWLIQSFTEHPTRRTPLSATKLRAAAPPFLAAPTTPHQHVAWRKLVDSATAP